MMNEIDRLTNQARQAAGWGQAAAAVSVQEEAVALARSAGDEPEDLVLLSGILYNLAIYYQAAGRFEMSVFTLEEVVALDEQTDHEDLESDRMTLESARRLARMSAEERGQWAAARVQSRIEQLTKQAQEARHRDDYHAAIAAQEAAVTLDRRLGQEQQALVQLSVLLYNLAGYYQLAGDLDEAVQALEEVVALDEQNGHEDLQADLEALERARKYAALAPSERKKNDKAIRRLAERLARR